MGAAKKPTKGRKKTAAKASSARAKTSKKKSARKPTAKKATARKRSAAKKTTRKRSAAKKTTRKATGAKKTSKKTASKAAARKPTKSPSKKTRKTAARKTVPKPRRPRKVNLSKEFLAETRERLLNEQAELTRQLREIEEDATTESEDTGQHEDFADAGTTTFERERDLSIRNNVLDLIDQVTRALARLDEGSYGACENCGQPIAVARIKAFPRVLMCLDCKRRDERTR